MNLVWPYGIAPTVARKADLWSSARVLTAADLAMERYANGEDAAFAEVYDAVAPRLLGYLHRAVSDEGAAQDLLQQTFLRMHRSRGSFAAGARVLPWAYAIARRLVVDHLRKNARSPQTRNDVLVVEPAHNPERQTAAREQATDLLARLRLLPEGHRAAFELVRLDGLSLREAALVLGTTVNAVKLRAHRAYVALGIGAADKEDA